LLTEVKVYPVKAGSYVRCSCLNLTRQLLHFSTKLLAQQPNLMIKHSPQNEASGEWHSIRFSN